MAYLAGSFFPRFRIVSRLVNTPAETRTFVWDGFLLMLIVAAVILIIEAAMKRIRTSGVRTSIALLLATILGLAAKLGFITVTH